MGVDPSFISSMQQLRTLSLRGPIVSDAQQPSNAAAALPLRRLLDGLSKLSQLEHLVISYTSEDDLEGLPASDVAKYSALLPAWTHLTSLQLCWEAGCLLPSDCWEHIFAANRQLRQLKQLWIGCPGSWWHEYDADDIAARVEGTAAALSGSDLDLLVECCPALELLSIPGMMQPLSDVSPLTGLTALTALFVGGVDIDDDVARIALAPLTQLQRLRIYYAPELYDLGLLALSALRKLTELGVWSCGVSEAVSDVPYDKRVELETKVGGCRLNCCCTVSAIPLVTLTVRRTSECELSQMLVSMHVCLGGDYM
jgi:hypothetical protein